MKSKIKIRKIGKAEQRRIERNTVWVLSCLSKRGREQFLGSYPSSAEAEEALREEFSDRRQPLVCGYDPARLLR